MESVICNLKNLAYFIKMKNERESTKSNDSQTLPSCLNFYSEKIVNDLVQDFSQIKSKFENFNFQENVNSDLKIDLAAANNQNKADLENNLNSNKSKRRNFFLILFFILSR